jgi:4-hydroxyphenylacetate 3-monooxygenase
MPARTGEEYLQGIRGTRNIWMNGEFIGDVVEHPGLRGAAHTLASVYDLQIENPDICLGEKPETGEKISLSHIVPRSKEDLYRRHACLQKIAEFSVGLMGRTPDYLNVTFAGFSGDKEAWGSHGNEAGAEHLEAYHQKLSREDWCLTHAIVSPGGDKSLGDAPKPNDTVTLHKVGDTEHGILVRGSKALATLAPFADELAVYPRTPMPEGAEAYMLAFSIPMSTPGLKFLCRDSMANPQHNFDHPFSGRFDEQDAFVIFDDVEIPHNRVFIDGNIAVYNTVMTKTWMPNIMHQTMIRACVKLKFAWALGRRMAAAVNDQSPATKQMLGEIWCYAEFANAAIISSEEKATDQGNGFWTPLLEPLFALRCMLPFWFPKVGEYLKLIGSHYLLAAPRQTVFTDPELRRLVDAYLGGAENFTSEERARIFRLGWDFIGTEMAGRNEQYERFYLGSGARNLQAVSRIAETKESDRLVDRFLDEEF